jgi:signal peptidase I
MSVIRAVGLFFLDFIETIVIALSIFVIIYIFLAQPHQVKGLSMMPNFVDGEYLLTNKISYRFEDPKRGDVVVFKAPLNEEYDYIKRIIGLPGDTVSIRSSQVFVNNHQLDESSYLSTDILSRGGRFIGENGEYTLKSDEYFVMGDNRNHSSDSRDWGPVPRSNIIGRAWLVYWPLAQTGLVKNIVYPSSLEATKSWPTIPLYIFSKLSWV